MARYAGGRRRALVLVASDGIGSLPNATRCALAVATAAQQAVVKYLRRRRSRRALQKRDAAILLTLLSKIGTYVADSAGGSTLNVTLFDPREAGQQGSVITIWSGDTRTCAADVYGQVYQLTEDHRDSEGALTSYIRLDGQSVGRLGLSVFATSRPLCAICITTDGVHDRCEAGELNYFLFHCVAEYLASNSELSSALRQFLDANISDNYSMALASRPVSLGQLARIRSVLVN